MGFKNQSVFTTTYTNTTFTVTEGMGIESITINLVSGSATLLGGLQFPGLTLSSVALSVGQPVVLNVNSGYTLTDITVDSTAGGVFQVYTVYAYNNAPDPSAAAYLAATGITGAVQSAAIDTLVKSLKATNLWSNMKAIYPFVTDNRNLLSYTEDFGNAFWSKSGLTITTNATTAPDGTTTADKLLETSGTINPYVTNNTTSYTIGQTYTLSVYAKASERNYAFIDLFLNGTDNAILVDLTNGTIVNTLGTTSNSSVTSVGNGWYRLSISVLASNLSGTSIAFGCKNSTNWGSYTGTAGNGIFAWGAQLELGSTATTYQPIATTQQAFISNQFKYNLVNPVDSDAAFRLVFNGGWTFSTNGATPNGVNAYADTKLNPTIALTNYNAHSSTYNRTNSDNVGWEIGLTQSVGSYVNEFLLAGRKTDFSVSGLYDFNNPNGEVKVASSSAIGFFQNSITSNTSHKLYKNGTQIGVNTNTNTTTPANGNIYLSAVNDINTTAIAFSIVQQAFVSIGNGLTDAQAFNLTRIVYAYQTALSRQVGVPIVSDPDAQAFINAADITDLTQANAINNLVIGLKADGLWTKMKAIYPFVGGTASTHKWNLKDPRDLDAAYRLVFNGGWTHSANGATPNGTNGYADTKFNNQGNWTSTSNGSMGINISTNPTAALQCDMGSGLTILNGNNSSTIYPYYQDGKYYGGLNCTSVILGTSNSSSIGLFVASRLNTTQHSLYKRGSSTINVTDTNAIGFNPNNNIYIGAGNDVQSNNARNYSNRRYNFSFIGDGLTQSEVDLYYARITTFNIALSR